MSGGFLMLNRGPETTELMQDPDAFCLLTQIAYRARRTNALNRYDLAPGEAMLGDYRAYGMTERRYRTAKAKLARWRLATFRATNKGTIATLCGTTVYDPNIESSDEQSDRPQTGERRASDEQSDRPATTNNNGNNPNNGNKENTELQLTPSSSDSIGIDVGKLKASIAAKSEALWKALLQNFPVRSDRTTRTFRWAVGYMIAHSLLGKPEAEQWLVDAVEWIQEARSNGTTNPAGRWISLVQEHTGLPKRDSPEKTARPRRGLGLVGVAS
jgi:hypothetical protein